MPFDTIVPDDIDFEKYMEETEPKARVKGIENYLAETMSFLAPIQTETDNTAIPIAGFRLNFREGETTLYAGFNNSGKSLLQGQVLTDLSCRGARACVASLEMRAGATVGRIARQMAGEQSAT